MTEPRFTEHLRLEPMAERHTPDLVTLHRDENVSHWYAGWLSTEEAAREFARSNEARWSTRGVAKWMAYDRASGDLVGRGGLSRLDPDADDARQIARLVAGWAPMCVELGWALRTPYTGRGLATEIGREALRFAFGEFGAEVVIVFTEVINARSRAVAERLGASYAGEITAEGLVEGSDDVHPDAPFAVYEIRKSALWL